MKFRKSQKISLHRMSGPNNESLYKTIGRYSVVILTSDNAEQNSVRSPDFEALAIPYISNHATVDGRSQQPRVQRGNINHVRSRSLSNSRDFRRSIRRIKRDALLQKMEAERAAHRSMSLRRALSQRLKISIRKCDGWYWKDQKESSSVECGDWNPRPRLHQQVHGRTPSYYERTMKRSRALHVHQTKSRNAVRCRSVPRRCLSLPPRTTPHRSAEVSCNFQMPSFEISKRNIRMKGQTFSGNRKLGPVATSTTGHFPL